jgi:hypothetical protein
MKSYTRIEPSLPACSTSEKLFRDWLKHENIKTFHIYAYCEWDEDDERLDELLGIRLSSNDAFVLSLKYPDIPQAIGDFFQRHYIPKIEDYNV